MAGIGLEFKSLQNRRSLFNYIRVIGYALALSVGPWLATTVAVGMICYFHMIEKPDFESMVHFTSLIMYIFAGSLVLASPFFMIISRFLADERHRGRPNQQKAARFSQFLLFPFALVAGTAGAFYFIPLELGNSALTQVMSVLLFVSLCHSWILLAHLDAEKRYATTLYAFAIGTGAAIAIAYYLRPLGWPQNGITGYALGYFIAFIYLFISVAIPARRKEIDTNFRPAHLIAYFKGLTVLGVIGLLYNLGVWIDKFVVWTVTGQAVAGSRMVVFTPYDIATFASAILMIPAVSYFLMVVETDFYDDYRSYLTSMETAPLNEIENKKNQLIATLRRHWNNLFELEAVVVVLGVIVGTWALTLMDQNPLTVKIFQRLSLAVFFQVLFWINIILLLYFEFRWRALCLALFFCASNAAFTWLFWKWQWPLGWGYVAAAASSTAVSWIALRHGFADLTRHCFTLYSPSSHARPS